MRRGSLALVLHAHLPFVRHPEHQESLEEEWLFEAITETYIPLIRMMQRLRADAVPFRLTMSITPPLCAMLQDGLLRERYRRHLTRSIQLAQREIARNTNHWELQDLSRFYCEQLVTTLQHYDACGGDLLSEFRELRDAGVLEIIGCAATHGLLPLLLSGSREAVRAQLLIGCDTYEEVFGSRPAGFWLPECAYTPALDPFLQEANIRWFILDSHALMLAKPRPRRAVYAPCFTPAGSAVFARDPDSSRQVWSSEIGYPGEPAYRDFYRDVGFDLPAHEVFPDSTLQIPRFTGLKYHRITSRSGPKELYNRANAEAAAHEHARHFLDTRTQQLRNLPDVDFEPILTMPFDAELFGHWWYEGPLFLESFIRQAAARRDEQVLLTTPGEYLSRNPRLEIATPAPSSWGENGYWSVWLDKSNAWIYPHLHSAARRMTELARRQNAAEECHLHNGRVLNQLARELLLAQSSDWAFLIQRGTAKHYATQRTNEHVQRFNTLYEQFVGGRVDEQFLSGCESRDNPFPHINWRHYL
jgi:1,4-alpha-glucan branching enzyme